MDLARRRPRLRRDFTENDVFLNSINPGNSVTGRIAFDVPKKAKISKVELHDSAFSGGVHVDLTGHS